MGRPILIASRQELGIRLDLGWVSPRGLTPGHRLVVRGPADQDHGRGNLCHRFFPDGPQLLPIGERRTTQDRPGSPWHHRGRACLLRTNRIEFISEYCDRWCERCAFTSRCSAYAVKTALGMCGDLREAHRARRGCTDGGGCRQSSRRRTIEIDEPTAAGASESRSRGEALAKRIEEVADLTKNAMERRGNRTSSGSAPAGSRFETGPTRWCREALAIAQWDSSVHRRES